MGLGAGHIADMISRMKQNRAQRSSNRTKFKENNREGIYTSDKESERPNFKVVSEEELKKIKKQIRTRALAERKRNRIINIILMVCGVMILFGILWALNQTVP